MRTAVRTEVPAAGRGATGHRSGMSSPWARVAVPLWLALGLAAGGASATGERARLAPETVDPLVAATRLLASGAPGLALARLESAGAHPEVARLRAEAARRLPPGLAGDRLRVSAAEALPGAPDAGASALAGAEAALRLPPAEHGPARARRLAARAIWGPANGVDPAHEPARRLVVRSLFAEGLDEEAYAALLRWRLDYPQADAQAIGEMAALLAGSRHAREAVPLVAMLPADSPTRWLLQARLGVTPPADVARRLRGALPATAAAWWWRLARDVGRAAGDPVLVSEASLRLLASGDAPDGGEAGSGLATVAPTPAEWLQADLRAATAAVATERQLLNGDDFGWMDEAARLAASDPPRARALFAGLATDGASAATREHARLQWVISMRESGLGRAAIRQVPPPGKEAGSGGLPTDLARQLGAAAAASGEPAAAAAYWRALPAPMAGDGREWVLTLAQALVDSGDAAEAVRRIRAMGSSPPWSDARVIELAERMTDAGASAQAMALLEDLALADRLVRGGWLARARAAEAEGLLGRPDRAQSPPAAARAPVLPPDAAFARAASAWLAAAAAGPADAVALEARLRAARNLDRAGLREAARAEIEAVARQAREPALREQARRALMAN